MVWNRDKIMTKDGVVLEFAPVVGEKHFQPRPQKRNLVTLRASFQNIPASTPLLFI